MCDKVTVRQKQWSHGGGVTGSEIITLPVRLTRVVCPTQTVEPVLVDAENDLSGRGERIYVLGTRRWV